MAQKKREHGAIRDLESWLNNGNPTFESLTVTGNTVMNGSLTVSGGITTNTLTVTGAAALGSLTVSGAGTLGSLLVTGATVVNGALTVSGGITTNTLTVSGAAALGSLTVSGNATVGSLTVTGNAVVNGSLTVSGAVSVSSLTVSGNATVNGNLTVTGSITMAGVQLRTPVQFGPYLPTASSVQLITSIASWANEVAMTVISLSLNGTGTPILQLWTNTGLVTAGYVGGVAREIDAGATTAENFSNGFRLVPSLVSGLSLHGRIVLQRHGTGNTWGYSFVGGRSDALSAANGGGHIVLPGALTGLSVNTATGTQVYDAGEIAGFYRY